jgi:curli production assembly/transport component CsgF
MKTNFINRNLISALLCATALGCFAGPLVYAPVNPTFGGNPGNASGLLANANAQNIYTAPVATGPALTPLQKFNQSLLNSVLSKLNSKLLGELFNSDGTLTVGSTIQSGNYEIKVTLADQATCNCPVGSVVLTTRDVTIAGSETSIIVGSQTN